MALVLLAGCARTPATRPPRLSGPAAHPLPRLGFTIQAGAFAQVEHAARLAEALQAKGLNAIYYAPTPGLYRVRFGDFPTWEAAKARAEALKAAGVIAEFHVVAPEEPPMARPRPQDERGLRANLTATARAYLGVPYLWGGTTAKGFDCSGLAMAVYRLNGLQLPRNSREQFDAGTAVSPDHLRPGDLLFFGPGGRGPISHVAIYVGNGTFVHASNRGRRIASASLSGTYFRETFVGARTYL
jgi:cell wall-associated NlpC family hydrolase